MKIITECEWCGKELTEEQEIFCSTECKKSWLKKEKFEELRFEGYDEEENNEEEDEEM
jgi:endogenous inhibitor of DNA gyrase (YacG/DUF329 family)